ncbi:TnsD family Tn7-like transposition protein [Paraburkholderia metrosideri]|uniref:Transposon Tn7 transposition protein TnsD C-termianl domain-containing protein n=1 Tax=Paraburkholderia metrosideri TaxID=580937 RepID=A0ABN7HJ41_9BURK|nr:TnsD family Tn7-like transposition protein [Paraburkholderia metrosideri]CAD6516540.1 hypothetical protein LMG28140_00799 [Paraburkholderia metrosideri]
MAIALLPLMEGESLESNFGRYAELMGLRSTDQLRKSLFGYACVVNTRLPSAIERLAQQTRDYWNLTGEEIVKNFTEFQYLTTMCSQPTREKLMKKMLRSPSRGGLPLAFGGSNGERRKTLRYCSECIEEWRDNGQPFYWKIDHQLTGVYCCAKHSTLLKTVDQSFLGETECFKLNKSIRKTDKTIFDNEFPPEKSAIEDVSRASVRLREKGKAYSSSQRFRDLLRDSGFTRANSTVRQSAFISAWLDYYGAQYCSMTGMNASRVANWIAGLSDRAIHRELIHPFFFIAAECFLEHCVSFSGSYLPKDRGKSTVVSKEFELGESNFESNLCKGALHRDSDVIEFSGSLRKSGWFKLVCTCGVSYRSPGLTKSEGEKFIPLAYGSRYQQRFYALLDEGKTLRRAAQELNITRATALSWRIKEEGACTKKLSQKEVNKLRADWRALVRTISSETRITTASEYQPGLYKTLKENDPGWFIAFNRAHRSWRPQSSYRNNEPTTDQIREAYMKIMLMEPPVRGSKVAILEKAGFRGGARRNQPFAACLENLVESHSAYHERVISWLGTRASEQQMGTLDEALRRAGLRLRSFTREQRRQILGLNSLSDSDSR